MQKPDIDDEEEIEYNPSYISEYTPPNEHKQQDKNIFFTDFEAEFQPRKENIPFMCYLSSLDAKVNNIFKRTDCDKQSLDFITKYSNPVIYFLNFAYDAIFLVRFGIHDKSFQKSKNKVFRHNIYHKDIRIQLRNSLPLINTSLEKFPKIFALKGEKEDFPYNYYTIQRLKNNTGNFREILKCIKSKLRLNINPNIGKKDGYDIAKEDFDMYKYAECYCKREVEIFRDVFMKFSDIVMNELNEVSPTWKAKLGFTKFNIDVFDIFSTQTLAHLTDIANSLKNSKIKSYSGKINAYLKRSIYGGRCTSVYNKV